MATPIKARHNQVIPSWYFDIKSPWSMPTCAAARRALDGLCFVLGPWMVMLLQTGHCAAAQAASLTTVALAATLLDVVLIATKAAMKGRVRGEPLRVRRGGTGKKMSPFASLLLLDILCPIG